MVPVDTCNWSYDGLLVSIPAHNGHADLAIDLMRKQHGFKWGNGPSGPGLYSPSWDRQMGEWGERAVGAERQGRRPRRFGPHEKCLWVNPSIVQIYLPEFAPKDEVRY